MNTNTQKSLAALAALTLMITMTACGGTDTNTNSNSSTAGSSDGKPAGDSASNGDTAAPSEVLYGRVTNIVGNEIEVALVKMPEADEPVEESSEAGGDAPVMDAVPMTPALPAGEVGVDVAENIELTGESIKVTIPAGVSINNIGQEGTLSSLKKGNLVSITVDSLEGMKVKGVNILE